MLANGTGEPSALHARGRRRRRRRLPTVISIGVVSAAIAWPRRSATPAMVIVRGTNGPTGSRNARKRDPAIRAAARRRRPGCRRTAKCRDVFGLELVLNDCSVTSSLNSTATMRPGRHRPSVFPTSGQDLVGASLSARRRTIDGGGSADRRRTTGADTGLAGGGRSRPRGDTDRSAANVSWGTLRRADVLEHKCAAAAPAHRARQC